MTVAALKEYDRASREEPRASFGEIQPLPPRLPAAPALPEELVPAVLRPWLTDISERMQVPLEMAAAPALVGIASLVGRKVAIAPKANDDWLVVPNLWGGIVASPGKLKSPTLAKTLAPIKELEREARQRQLEVKDRLDTTVDVLEAKQRAVKGELQRAFKKSDKGKSPEALQEELLAIRAELREVEAQRSAKRYVVNDPTTEKLGELLAANPQGLLLERDELAGWLQALHRRDRPGDREFFLEGWNGTNAYTYDRIGRGTIHIPAICISIVGGIQPAKLSRFVADALSGGYAADGLLQRFQLLVWPEHSTEWRLVDRAPSAETEARVRSLYQQLDALPESAGAELARIRFDHDAQELFYQWLTELEQRLRSDEIASYPSFESHLAKYRSMMPSLALLFQLIESPSFDQCVLREAASLAADWCDFLEAHARKIYAPELGLDSAPAHALAQKIRSGAIASGCTIRDIYNHGWSHLKTSDQVLRAVEILEDRGWVHLGTKASGRRGGRPSPVILINPAAVERP